MHNPWERSDAIISAMYTAMYLKYTSPACFMITLGKQECPYEQERV
jgi:hypothetical protein